MKFEQLQNKRTRADLVPKALAEESDEEDAKDAAPVTGVQERSVKIELLSTWPFQSLQVSLHEPVLKIKAHKVFLFDTELMGDAKYLACVSKFPEGVCHFEEVWRFLAYKEQPFG